VENSYTPSPSPSNISERRQSGAQSDAQPSSFWNDPGSVITGPSSVVCTSFVRGSKKNVTEPPGCDSGMLAPFATPPAP
jgi:hypothetical protein